MKLIIAGTVTFNLDIGTIQNLIDITIPMDKNITEVVAGSDRGVSVSGRNYAEFQEIPVRKFNKDIHNDEISKYGDALLLIWNGESEGLSNLKLKIEQLNKPIYEVLIK